MKKIIFLIICICVVLCLVQGNASAKAVYDDGLAPWGAVEGQFFYSHWWRNTPNDWVKVGSAGYEAYFNLANPYDGLPDISADPAPTDNDDITLLIGTIIDPGTGVDLVPAGTWAGYEWTVPATSANTNGGISTIGERLVKYWQVTGWSTYWAPGSRVYLVDGEWDGLSDPAATGHVLWSLPAQFTNTKDTLTHSSATIRFIIYIPETVMLFPTNYVRAKLMNMWTEVYVPACGDSQHPYPVGDLNQDCKVNFKDFAVFAENWLDCNNPAAPCNAL